MKSSEAVNEIHWMKSAAPIRQSVGISAFLLLLAINPSCTGTEGDNPFTDPAKTTNCKGDSDYSPLSSAPAFGNLSRDELAAERQQVANKSPASVRQKVQRLTALEEVPVWLECVEWELIGNHIDFQVANFRGGCAIEWKGGSRVDQNGRIVVELENGMCAVAACGSCIYDMRAEGGLELEDPGEVITLTLIRNDCHGDATRESSWDLPVGERASGMLCGEADLWGAESAAGMGNEGVEIDLYAPCDAEVGGFLPAEGCAEGLSCVQNHCVPACVGDDDCPLHGAMSCQEGACQLIE